MRVRDYSDPEQVKGVISVADDDDLVQDMLRGMIHEGLLPYMYALLKSEAPASLHSAVRLPTCWVNACLPFLAVPSSDFLQSLRA